MSYVCTVRHAKHFVLTVRFHSTPEANWSTRDGEGGYWDLTWVLCFRIAQTLEVNIAACMNTGNSNAISAFRSQMTDAKEDLGEDPSVQGCQS